VGPSCHSEKEKSTVASSDQTWLAASWEVCQPLKLEIIEGESSNCTALRRSKKSKKTLWIEDKPGLPSQVGATMLYVVYNLQCFSPLGLITPSELSELITFSGVHRLPGLPHFIQITSAW
jgi:hypothetical protein